jgi:hypothetical protein
MNKSSKVEGMPLYQLEEPKKEKGILKAIGSVLIAIFASSHHWVHTLLIALGLTSLGTGLFSLSPWVKIVFMLISLVISVLMLRVQNVNLDGLFVHRFYLLTS